MDMIKEETVKGIGRWYCPIAGRPGKFSLTKDASVLIPFVDKEQVVFEYNKELDAICISKL